MPECAALRLQREDGSITVRAALERRPEQGAIHVNQAGLGASPSEPLPKLCNTLSLPFSVMLKIVPQHV